MKNNKYEIDMCNGSIMDKLISFSLPLMLSGVLQLMFNVWIYLIFPQHRSLDILFISYPASWAVTIVMQACCLFLVRKKVHRELQKNRLSY